MSTINQRRLNGNSASTTTQRYLTNKAQWPDAEGAKIAQ